MDYVRTPYTRAALLTPDGNVVVTLRWYPAPPGAKLFPFWHRFASGDWSVKDLPSVWNGVGELKTARRRWWKGTPVAAYKGQCFIGPLDWYQNGVPFAASQIPAGFPPVCCLDMEEPGSSYAPGPTPVIPGNCAYIAAVYPQIVLTLAGDGCFAGSYVLTYNPTLHVWESPFLPVPCGMPFTQFVAGCSLSTNMWTVNSEGSVFFNFPSGFMSGGPDTWTSVPFFVDFGVQPIEAFGGGSLGMAHVTLHGLA